MGKINKEAFQVFEGITGKPMANYYGCRLKAPNYDEYAYERCASKHSGKCIDHVYGIKSGKSELQALRYSKKVWTRSAASSHCSSRSGSFDA